MHFIVKLIGTFGFTGFFPIAPATFASFVFALLYLAIPGGEVLANPIVALITLILSVPVASRLENRYGHDAGCIVIDEVVGMQIVFVGAKAGVSGVVLGFFLFRIYDVFKPFPIHRSQRLPGGFGIVCDDFLAGIYARLTIVLIMLFYPNVGDFI